MSENEIDWEREAQKQLHIRVFVELQNEDLRIERDRYQKALLRLRDCDWVISLPDRMDAVREIAREALSND